MKTLAALCLLSAFSPSSLVYGQALAKSELGELTNAYEKRRAEALKPVKTWYQAQLETLQKKYVQNNDLEAAVMVKDELEVVRRELGDDNFPDLRIALLGNHWSWSSKPTDKGVEMTFFPDGKVSHIGMKGTWVISGARELTLVEDKGEKRILKFDASLKSYRQTNGQVYGKTWDSWK